jgi:hypothetical protein
LRAAVRGARIATGAPRGFGTRALALQLSERTLARPNERPATKLPNLLSDKFHEEKSIGDAWLTNRRFDK